MKLIWGDSLLELKQLKDNSVDSIVTDPPYGLTNLVVDTKMCGDCGCNSQGSFQKQGHYKSCPKCGSENIVRNRKNGNMGGFMGKKWDGTGIENNVDMWAECLRVLKPGGHLLSFGGTRTYHRMAVAIEDAGFDVRNMVVWAYGSGMSKGNVWGKDKKRTSERLNKENNLMVANGYEGWGNVGLKPAIEPIAWCRKPIEKGLTVAENVLKYGTGGINIDESRVEGTQEYLDGKGNPTQKQSGDVYGFAKYDKLHTRAEPNTQGRFPANLILSWNSDEYMLKLDVSVDDLIKLKKHYERP